MCLCLNKQSEESLHKYLLTLFLSKSLAFPAALQSVITDYLILITV